MAERLFFEEYVLRKRGFGSYVPGGLPGCVSSEPFLKGPLLSSRWPVRPYHVLCQQPLPCCSCITTQHVETRPEADLHPPHALMHWQRGVRQTGVRTNLTRARLIKTCPWIHMAIVQGTNIRFLDCRAVGGAARCRGYTDSVRC